MPHRGEGRKGKAMSTELPRIEARVSAQERMQTILHARLEELAQDMKASFDQQTQYQVQIEQKIDAVDARLNKIEATIATKEDVAALKEDITTLEKRVLNAFQQLLTLIDQRLPPLEKY